MQLSFLSFSHSLSLRFLELSKDEGVAQQNLRCGSQRGEDVPLTPHQRCGIAKPIDVLELREEARRGPRPAVAAAVTAVITTPGARSEDEPSQRGVHDDRDERGEELVCAHLLILRARDAQRVRDELRGVQHAAHHCVRRDEARRDLDDPASHHVRRERRLQLR